MLDSVKEFFSGILKAVFSAVIITLVGVLIFAGLLKFTLLSQSVIKSVNQFIKIIAIFLGCSLNIRGKSGLVRGVVMAFLTTIVTYLLFSLFCGQIIFGNSFILDLIFTSIIGGVSGIISVNIKK
ncbi:MAG: TIGR04086 family membrane protein [Clostridiales bacterium]|nr:TIGR04086 family membrane protein [Clostridiales bacterium]